MGYLKGSEKVDDLTDRQIKATFDAELVKKGLSKSDSDSADRLVGYQAAISTEKEVTSYDTGWGYGPGWRYGYGAPGISTSTTSTLYVGTLAVDMYDPGKKQLVWRGTATKTLDEKPSRTSARRTCRKQRPSL